MNRIRTTTSIHLVLLLIVACEPRIPSTDEGDEDPPADLGAEAEDPGNCGEQGLNCIGALGIGSCVDGECGPKLSGCSWASGTCSELCAEAGGSCQPLACDGATAWHWPSASEQQSSDLCGFADVETAVALDIGCDEALDGKAWYVSCCCG